jgi:hypothetical protein
MGFGLLPGHPEMGGRGIRDRVCASRPAGCRSLPCILERAARGRADAKEKGVKFGRKPTLTPHQQKEARKRLEAGEPQRSVARSYNVSRRRFHDLRYRKSIMQDRERFAISLALQYRQA